MKRNKSAKSISFLLGRYYLTFTAILVLLFLGLFLAWNFYFGVLFSIPNPQELVQSRAFQEGDYQHVDSSRYLGRQGAFALYDSQGALVYQSSSKLPALDTGELDCLSLYDRGEYTILTPFTTADGQQRWLLTSESYPDGQLQTKVAVLDDTYRVLEGSVTPGKEQYTRRELDLLTDQWSQDYLLTRMDITDSQGQPLILVLLQPRYYDYMSAAQEAGQLLLLAIPPYLVVIFTFIVLLNRHFSRPLARLNQAIVQLGAGEAVSAASCGGPAEVQALGRSFDAMAQRLALSQAETRRLEQQRIQMLTDISHDLKTPITVIMGYANAIRDGKVPQEELPRYLDTIAQKAQGLTQLIQQFHLYSQTQNPHFRIEPADTDLCEYLREYLADKFGEIDLAGFSLEVEIPEDSPLMVSLDPFQLGRALDNIVSNALRHNPPGTVIGVSLAREDAAARLVIWDTGGGIPPELKQDLFTPFAVGDRSRSKGGSGLGLSIAQKILQAHGWEICLTQPPHGGHGTAFLITLPL